MNKLGIALGGGGVRGIAHIAYLKAIDDAGIKPAIISGTSSGALAGALYAGGLKPDEIFGMIEKLIGKRKDIRRGFKRIKLLPKAHLSEAIRGYISDMLPKRNFEELIIPLKVTATNLYTLEEKVFTKGSILDAVMASMAYPRVIGPQLIDGEYYIDGGAVNLVPFDTIRGDCEALAAIDVSVRKPESIKPDIKDARRAYWDAAQNKITNLKLRTTMVEIFERPEFNGVGTLDFRKYGYVYEKALEYTPEFIKKLKKLCKGDKNG